MSSNYFLKSISFENYRGLNGLNIPTFRRINLIGGFNGTGKSSLLEAIFFLLDRRGPISFTRTYSFRGLGMNGLNSLDHLFSNLDRSMEIGITAETSGGKLNIKMRFGHPPPGVSVQIPGSRPLIKLDSLQSMSNDTGLSMEATIDGRPDDALFALPMPDGLTVNMYRAGTSKIPIGALVSPSTRNLAQDTATRFSSVVRANRLPELLKIISVIRPNIVGIQLLQDGPAPILFAQFENGTLHPFAMLGDGIQTMLSIALAIMNSPGGIVLLDEFDSAIHYSILTDVWSKIAVLANTYNCQIFAVTHSHECIQAALEGVKAGSRIEAFQYARLERSGIETSAVTYSGKELEESLNAGWEIR